MSIQKKYLKTRPVCKVTFRIPEEVGMHATCVCVVGEFNDWNVKATPMAQLKNGSFKATLDLDKGREYQFRYLVNKKEWKNDGDADKYVATPYGDSTNSVVVV